MSNADQASMPADPASDNQPHHASFVFLLDDLGQVHPLPHTLYVALGRDGAGSESLAGKRLRLADWYVRLKDGVPDRVVDEWYGWVRFNDRGCFDPSSDRPQRPPIASGSPAMDDSAFPTIEERHQMESLLFAEAP